MGLTVFFVLGLTTVFVVVRHHWTRYATWCLRRARRLVEPRPDRAVRRGLMNRQHLDPARNAYHNFVTIPRQLPGLAIAVLARSRVVLPAPAAAVISSRLLQIVRCPDCHGGSKGAASTLRLPGMRPIVSEGTPDFLVLRPSDAFGETTKFLDESFHSDGRDETVSPPLLSAAVRNTMLRKFLDMQPDDVVLDLGCGSGRFCVWSAETGAHLVGADTGTFFAREALSTVDLVVGELRKLPFADGSVTKAYTIDVLEHLSPDGLTATLDEVARVLQPGGALFVYTHVRQRSVLAPLLSLVARISLAIERPGFADLTIEKLRKTDHLNPLMSRSHLDEVAAEAGFTCADFATTRRCFHRSPRASWCRWPRTPWPDGSPANIWKPRSIGRRCARLALQRSSRSPDAGWRIARFRPSPGS